MYMSLCMCICTCVYVYVYIYMHIANLSLYASPKRRQTYPYHEAFSLEVSTNLLILSALRKGIVNQGSS